MRTRVLACAAGGEKFISLAEDIARKAFTFQHSFSRSFEVDGFTLTMKGYDFGGDSWLDVSITKAATFQLYAVPVSEAAAYGTTGWGTDLQGNKTHPRQAARWFTESVPASAGLNQKSNANAGDAPLGNSLSIRYNVRGMKVGMTTAGRDALQLAVDLGLVGQGAVAAMPTPIATRPHPGNCDWRDTRTGGEFAGRTVSWWRIGNSRYSGGYPTHKFAMHPLNSTSLPHYLGDAGELTVATFAPSDTRPDGMCPTFVNMLHHVYVDGELNYTAPAGVAVLCAALHRDQFDASIVWLHVIYGTPVISSDSQRYIVPTPMPDDVPYQPTYRNVMLVRRQLTWAQDRAEIVGRLDYGSVPDSHINGIGFSSLPLFNSSGTQAAGVEYDPMAAQKLKNQTRPVVAERVVVITFANAAYGVEAYGGIVAQSIVGANVDTQTRTYIGADYIGDTLQKLTYETVVSDHTNTGVADMYSSCTGMPSAVGDANNIYYTDLTGMQMSEYTNYLNTYQIWREGGKRTAGLSAGGSNIMVYNWGYWETLVDAVGNTIGYAYHPAFQGGPSGTTPLTVSAWIKSGTRRTVSRQGEVKANGASIGSGTSLTVSHVGSMTYGEHTMYLHRVEQVTWTGTPGALWSYETCGNYCIASSNPSAQGALLGQPYPTPQTSWTEQVQAYSITSSGDFFVGQDSMFGGRVWPCMVQNPVVAADMRYGVYVFVSPENYNVQGSMPSSLTHIVGTSAGVYALGWTYNPRNYSYPDTSTWYAYAIPTQLSINGALQYRTAEELYATQEASVKAAFDAMWARKLKTTVRFASATQTTVHQDATAGCTGDGGPYEPPRIAGGYGGSIMPVRVLDATGAVLRTDAVLSFTAGVSYGWGYGAQVSGVFYASSGVFEDLKPSLDIPGQHKILNALISIG